MEMFGYDMKNILYLLLIATNVGHIWKIVCNTDLFIY